MTTSSLFQSIQYRFPWSALKAVLRILGLPPSQGMKKTIIRLNDIYREEQKNASEGYTDNIKKFEELKNLYKQHLLVGEKTVRIFRLSDNQLEKISSLFSSCTSLNEGSLMKAYPFVDSRYASTAFNDTQSEEQEEFPTFIPDPTPKLVAIDSLENNSKVFVFSSERLVFQRNKISIANFRSQIDGTESLSLEEDDEEIDISTIRELIAIRKEVRQFFDVVVLREEEKILEFRIDTTLKVSKEELILHFRKLTNHFRDLVRNDSSEELILDTQINFFPLINSLYQSQEGEVCAVSFTTDEGLIENSKMRLKDSDLRTESFHSAGSEASEITPFRLDIKWKKFLSSDLGAENQNPALIYPRLFLPGTFYDVSQQYNEDDTILDPLLNYVMVSGCVDIESYDFLFGKIIEHITYADNEQG